MCAKFVAVVENISINQLKKRGALQLGHSPQTEIYGNYHTHTNNDDGHIFTVSVMSSIHGVRNCSESVIR